jgi:hypothetical protein
VSALKEAISQSTALADVKPKLKDKYEERAYLKERLALALRIFGYLGYDEGSTRTLYLKHSNISVYTGVAGHIT